MTFRYLALYYKNYLIFNRTISSRARKAMFLKSIYKLIILQNNYLVFATIIAMKEQALFWH